MSHGSSVLLRIWVFQQTVRAAFPRKQMGFVLLLAVPNESSKSRRVLATWLAKVRFSNYDHLAHTSLPEAQSRDELFGKAGTFPQRWLTLTVFLRCYPPFLVTWLTQRHERFGTSLQRQCWLSKPASDLLLSDRWSPCPLKCAVWPVAIAMPHGVKYLKSVTY